MVQDCQVERWGVFEARHMGPREGNPFIEVSFGAQFVRGHRRIDVDGFYDGDGTYRVRFMPDSLGEWRYRTRSNVEEMDGLQGRFLCVDPGPDNHGPVQVRDTYHLAYADGTPYWQFGTTCYAWVHQGQELEDQTLATLSRAPFNKLRMCVFPKHYAYNQNEPRHQPFGALESGSWDWSRFNPAFWRHLESRVGDLQRLGIEADLILFHPYDCWGYATMDAETDERYLRYAVARLAAYRNVWWSMANEYDLMPAKSTADWDRFFHIVQESDPYQHMRSVHNCRTFYDHGKPWVTHQSIQHAQVEQTGVWRDQYHKPVVIDECRYEGDIPQQWGCLSGPEMVHKFWEAVVRGGYAGHGETYLHADDILWWAKGGALHGQSTARIGFLREIVETGPSLGWEPVEGIVTSRFACATKGGEHYLAYFGGQQPAIAPFQMPDESPYRVDVIDTWAMTMVTLPGLRTDTFEVPLPGKPYMAVRLRREPAD